MEGARRERDASSQSHRNKTKSKNILRGERGLAGRDKRRRGNQSSPFEDTHPGGASRQDSKVSVWLDFEIKVSRSSEPSIKQTSAKARCMYHTLEAINLAYISSSTHFSTNNPAARTAALFWHPRLASGVWRNAPNQASSSFAVQAFHSLWVATTTQTTAAKRSNSHLEAQTSTSPRRRPKRRRWRREQRRQQRRRIARPPSRPPPRPSRRRPRSRWSGWKTRRLRRLRKNPGLCWCWCWCF